jgi:UPF0716 protein FxsA
MRRWLRYLPLVLLIPLVDAIILVVTGLALQSVVGVLASAVIVVSVVVLTGLVGGLLVRAEGRKTIRRFREQLSKAQIPTDELLDGGFLIAAGAFLLTPGLVTDLIGFLFTLPPSRVPIRTALKKYVIVPYLDERTDGFVTGTVYTGGFPEEDGDGPAGSPFGPDGAGPDGFDGEGQTAYDLDPESYDIDIEDVEDVGSSSVDDTDEDTDAERWT